MSGKYNNRLRKMNVLSSDLKLDQFKKALKDKTYLLDKNIMTITKDSSITWKEFKEGLISLINSIESEENIEHFSNFEYSNFALSRKPEDYEQMYKDYYDNNDLPYEDLSYYNEEDYSCPNCGYEFEDEYYYEDED